MSKLLLRIMYNLRLIGKMLIYFLLTGSIDGINLCMGSIKMYFDYFIFHIGHNNFNTLKIVLCMENLAVSQIITFNKRVISHKKV